MGMIKRYNEFVNEEIGRKAIIGGALAGSIALSGIGAHMRDKSSAPTEQISSVRKEIPNKFMVNEEILSFGHDFWITNKEGENFGKVEERVMSVGQKFELISNIGELEAVAKARFLTLYNIVDISSSGGSNIGRIEEEVIESIKNTFNGQNIYSIFDGDGNLVAKSKADVIIQNNIDIYDLNDELVARFHKPAIQISDRWSCEIFTNSIDRRILVFIPCFISSKVTHSSGSSKRSELDNINESNGLIDSEDISEIFQDTMDLLDNGVIKSKIGSDLIYVKIKTNLDETIDKSKILRNISDIYNTLDISISRVMSMYDYSLDNLEFSNSNIIPKRIEISFRSNKSKTSAKSIYLENISETAIDDGDEIFGLVDGELSTLDRLIVGPNRNSFRQSDYEPLVTHKITSLLVGLGKGYYYTTSSEVAYENGWIDFKGTDKIDSLKSNPLYISNRKVIDIKRFDDLDEGVKKSNKEYFDELGYGENLPNIIVLIAE